MLYLSVEVIGGKLADNIKFFIVMKHLYNNESLKREIMDLEAMDFSKISGGHVSSTNDAAADSEKQDCYGESFKQDSASQN